MKKTRIFTLKPLFVQFQQLAETPGSKDSDRYYSLNAYKMSLVCFRFSYRLFVSVTRTVFRQ